MSTTKDITINTTPGTKEIVIREGAAPIVREENKINLIGTINAPVEYFTKRKTQIKPENSNVVYSYDKMHVTLTVDEKNHFCTTVKGELKDNPELKQFKINQNETFTVKGLKSVLKMNRYFFADTDENVKIVMNLEKFRAGVQTQIEQHATGRGEKKELFEVQTNTNLDLSFVLNMPIFIGEPAVKFKVEICFDVHGNDVTVWLESPDLRALYLSTRDKIIQRSLEPFKDKFPVIEQ